jgi:hypothetical protein
MKTKFSRDFPEDVLICIKLLLYYFSTSADEEPAGIYSRTLKRACRVLDVRSTLQADGRITWALSAWWKKRLRMAGVNPENPTEILDSERWDLAWQQLKETGTFRHDIQQKNIAQGFKAPQAGAETTAWAQHVEYQESPADVNHSDAIFSSYLPPDLRRKFAK